MNNIVITSGTNYVDIDAVACILAYKEFLKLKNIESIALITAAINSSITPSMKSWNLEYSQDYKIKPEDRIIIMDISEKEYLEKSYNLNQVIELYDHHFGFEEFWHEKLGTKSVIQPVGSCATLIWEKFREENLEDKISTTSVNLLYTAIISNTLNFRAQITHQRDIDAAKSLEKYIDLNKNWDEVYFEELEEIILRNPTQAILNDTKHLTLDEKDLAISQIELWDNEKFIKENYDVIINILRNSNSSLSFFTSPNIKEGFNYIICENEELKKQLEKIIDVKFDGNLGKTNKLWLRKEIIREYNKLLSKI